MKIIQSVVGLALGFSILSHSALAGTSNCQLKVDAAVKTIFKYDTDQSGTVSVEEALAAYPEFKTEIESRLPGVSDRVGQAAYTFLLKKGWLLNQAGNIRDQIRMLFWMLKKRVWKFELKPEQVEKAAKNLFQCN